HGARRLQEAGGDVAVEGDVDIGGVVGHEEVVLPGEAHRPGEGVRSGGRGGRVVGVVEPQDLGGDRVAGADLVQPGLEPVGSRQGDHDRPAAGEDGAGGVDGVAGIGHEHDVTGVDEGRGEVVDA